ncbi:redoxin domain-containing protein [candidate division KSB1 bacterium]|nr:redoxin domain-containing protein [candidate division KSB1 bacterium]
MKQFYMFLSVLLVTVLAGTGISNAVETGDSISSFLANDAGGKLWQSRDHNENLLVIYFYPAALTGGCTAQACSFRDDKGDLETMGVTVVGVSGDPVVNLNHFKKVNHLNYTLLSDVNGVIASLFEVPKRKGGVLLKEIDGEKITLKRSYTFARWTFVVDQNTVVYKDTDVEAQTDSRKIKTFIKEYLQSE